jgi:DNA-binding MarR family transcriptional regulator
MTQFELLIMVIIDHKRLTMSIPEQHTFTDKQGQYLAFIYHYTKVNRIPPAHTDMQHYFRVTPPSVNSMVKILEKKGFIEKQPRTARSIKLLISVDLLPKLN